MLTNSCNWDGLDKLRVGRFGEYFAKMAFTRAGYDVYSPEVDDRAIDFVIRTCGAEMRYLEIQVKTVRLARSSYVFMRKKHFPISPDRYLALVTLKQGEEPELYLIPSTVWADPAAPFVSRDYEGKKSDPEYGLTASAKNLNQLGIYRFTERFELAA